MSRKRLFTLLNTLCSELDIKYNINNGGCCFVAAVIAEQLELCNIPYTAYEYDHPCHYVIRVSDRYINRGDFTGFKTIIDNCTSKILYDIYHWNDWNEMYSKRWNLIVKSKIKSLFNKYENSRA